MTAVADWHGRVIMPELNLRGDISKACERLKAASAAFDIKEASKAPFRAPLWIQPMLTEEGGAVAMRSYLEEVHPRDGQKSKAKFPFTKLVDVYCRLDTQGIIARFCKHYCAGCEYRAPKFGAYYPGYQEEVKLLEEMSYASNDSIKFLAISTYGKFAPLKKIMFLKEREEAKLKDCQNPNIILCRCANAVGDIAMRCPELENQPDAKVRLLLLKVLPWLSQVLDQEGRNNGACALASESIKEIIAVTGAPQALEAFLHNFKAPSCDSQWMVDYTDRYHENALQWIKDCTGQDFGKDFKAWKRWFDKNKSALYYEPGKMRFVIDARAARVYRSGMR